MRHTVDTHRDTLVPMTVVNEALRLARNHMAEYLRQRTCVPLWTEAERALAEEDPAARCDLTGAVVPVEHLVRVRWGDARRVHPGVHDHFRRLGRQPHKGEDPPASALETPEVAPEDLPLSPATPQKFHTLTRPAIMKCAAELGLTERLARLLKHDDDPALAGMDKRQIRQLRSQVHSKGDWRHWPKERIAEALTSLWLEQNGRRRRNRRLDPTVPPAVFKVPA